MGRSMISSHTRVLIDFWMASSLLHCYFVLLFRHPAHLYSRPHCSAFLDLRGKSHDTDIPGNHTDICMIGVEEAVSFFLCFTSSDLHHLVASDSTALSTIQCPFHLDKPHKDMNI